MIFLLIFFLLINLIISFSINKDIVSPSNLVGMGMLLAACVAGIYYKEWGLRNFSFLSTVLMGGGTFSFTLGSFFFRKRKSFEANYSLHKISFSDIVNRTRLIVFYFFSVVVGLCGLYLKYKYMRSFFGPMAISELIGALRIDEMEGERLFEIPGYVRMIGSYTVVLSSFSIWLLSIMKLSNVKDSLLMVLLICQFIIAIIDSLFGGAKGDVFGLFVKCAVIYLFMYYAHKGSLRLKKSFVVNVIVLFILGILSFKTINLFIGRAVEERSNIDLVAEYCGAEIKNFDIYLHQSKEDRRSIPVGSVTFRSLYNDFGISSKSVSTEGFQFYGVYNLGNVYTMFYSFHKDFGNLGCFILPLLFSLITNIIYAKAIVKLRNPYTPNVLLFIYAAIAMSLFMSFFSCKITESNFNLGFFRTIIYFMLLGFFFKKIILKKLK